MNRRARAVADTLVETAAIVVIIGSMLYLAYKFGIYLATGGA